LSGDAASLPDAAVDSANQAASSIADAARDSSAAVQDAAASTPDSSTSALSGCAPSSAGLNTVSCHTFLVKLITPSHISTSTCALLACVTCVAVLAEAAKSTADTVSNTASDLLGGASDGVSAARDAAQQLLDSANGSTGDLQSAASDIQGSVSSSLSSAFETLQTSTSSAVGASGGTLFAAQPALQRERSSLTPTLRVSRRTARVCAAGAVSGQRRSQVRSTASSRHGSGSAGAGCGSRGGARRCSACHPVTTLPRVWWLDRARGGTRYTPGKLLVSDGTSRLLTRLLSLYGVLLRWLILWMIYMQREDAVLIDIREDDVRERAGVPALDRGALGKGAAVPFRRLPADLARRCSYAVSYLAS